LIYNSARRDADSFVLEVEHRKSSAPVEYPASADGWTFFYSYKTFIDDVPLIYTPRIPEGVQNSGHIDAGITTTITIPAVDTTIASLTTPLTGEAYIVIQNKSVFSFFLKKGAVIKKPENYSAAQDEASYLVNSDEKAVYKCTGGESSALYKLSINGSDTALSGITETFAAGHIYNIILNGQNAATLAPVLESDKAITLVNVSMAQGTNNQFSFTTWRDKKSAAEEGVESESAEDSEEDEDDESAEEIPGDNTLEFYANSVKLSGSYWNHPDGNYSYSGQILESEYRAPSGNYPNGALVIWTKKTESRAFVLRVTSENNKVILQNGNVLFYK
jgi:hypothetical protein